MPAYFLFDNVEVHDREALATRSRSAPLDAEAARAWYDSPAYRPLKSSAAAPCATTPF